jgi:hypothetical protein
MKHFVVHTWATPKGSPNMIRDVLNGIPRFLSYILYLSFRLFPLSRPIKIDDFQRPRLFVSCRGLRYREDLFKLRLLYPTNKNEHLLKAERASLLVWRLTDRTYLSSYSYSYSYFNAYFSILFYGKACNYLRCLSKYHQ